jgi:hypothetical protein
MTSASGPIAGAWRGLAFRGGGTADVNAWRTARRHVVAARQLADRHPFLPVLPADTLELLHPRHSFPPTLVMAMQDQPSVRMRGRGWGQIPEQRGSVTGLS